MLLDNPDGSLVNLDKGSPDELCLPLVLAEPGRPLDPLFLAQLAVARIVHGVSVNVMAERSGLMDGQPAATRPAKLEVFVDWSSTDSDLKPLSVALVEAQPMRPSEELGPRRVHDPEGAFGKDIVVESAGSATVTIGVVSFGSHASELRSIRGALVEAFTFDPRTERTGRRLSIEHMPRKMSISVEVVDAFSGATPSDATANLRRLDMTLRCEVPLIRFVWSPARMLVKNTVDDA